MRHSVKPFLLIAAAAACFAEDAIVIFRPLPQPLRLPPGLTQTLDINKTASYFGDTLRPVDCENDIDLPFGICSNFLFGGHAMTSSHLEGRISIRFYPPVRNVSHFEVRHFVLSGDDSVLQTPGGYSLPVLANSVTDGPDLLSEGDLDLTTGGVANIKYRVLFTNTALLALGGVNPKLTRPTIEFPGVRGRAWIRFEQRPDGLLDYTFSGTTFLPLGKDILGDPVRWPMANCDPAFHCASVLARGTSLHPHLAISTREPGGPSCFPNCPNIPYNSIQEFTVSSHSSSFGDDFELDVPQLGGIGPGRSHIHGRLLVQFGPKTGDTVPFIIRSLPPAGLIQDPPVNAIFGRGFGPGLLGHEEFLRFPRLTYKLERVVFVDEPFAINHGHVDLRTGRVIGEFFYPSFFGQSLAEVLFAQNDGRISTLPFDVIAKSDGGIKNPGYALFERGANGQTIFRLSAEHIRSFATFRFPSPDYVKANSFVAGPDGLLSLFLRLQAMRTQDTPRAVKSGTASNILTSLGDRISFNYSVPCDGKSSRLTFEYTNNNSGRSGGTFRMLRLANVTCFNSRGSTMPAGDYDTVTVSGFGTWSKDVSGDPPRFGTFHISTSPTTPYVSVFVFQNPDENGNVILSSANTKPAEKPLP
jgi:hypothetical protein